MGKQNPAEVAAEIISETYTIEHVNGEDSITHHDYVDISGMEQPIRGGVMLGAPTVRDLLESGLIVTAFQVGSGRTNGDARVWVARVGLDGGQIVTE